MAPRLSSRLHGGQAHDASGPRLGPYPSTSLRMRGDLLAQDGGDSLPVRKIIRLSPRPERSRRTWRPLDLYSFARTKAGMTGGRVAVFSRAAMETGTAGETFPPRTGGRPHPFLQASDARLTRLPHPIYCTAQNLLRWSLACSRGTDFC